MHKVIINSTPLIALSHVDKLSLLKDLYGEVTIPVAVYEEISAKKDSVCKAQVDSSLDWIHIDTIQNQMAKEMFKTQLHSGEVEVMILAKETDADRVIIDDKNAKKYAKYLGLTVTGTLGVLLRAKEQGYISELKPVIDDLLNHHIYLSSELIDMCLKYAGEQ